MATTLVMVNGDDFNHMFSFPRTPTTSLGPGQRFELSVPKGKKVLVKDVYIQNLGQGKSLSELGEKRDPAGFEIRYSFFTQSHDTTIINFSTGLKFGDEYPITAIAILNDYGSVSPILPRICGVFID